MVLREFKNHARGALLPQPAAIDSQDWQSPPMQLPPACQYAVTVLGQQALAGLALDALFEATVACVVHTLQVPYGRIWQVQSDGKRLRSCAQIGWGAETAGTNFEDSELETATRETTRRENSKLATLEIDTHALPALSVLLHATSPIVLQPDGPPGDDWVRWMPPDSTAGLGLSIFAQNAAVAFLEIYAGPSLALPTEAARFLQAVGQVLATAITRKRSEDFLATQGQILEKVAAGLPLTNIFQHLCQRVEAQTPGTRCAIALVDKLGTGLQTGVAPSFPADYAAFLSKLEVGEAQASSGTAAYRKTTVFVQDIATDPLWQEFRDFALERNIQACWSMPFFSQAGEVLGTVSLCHPVVCGPQSYHEELMQAAAHLASLAVEQQQTAERLQQAALYDSLTGLYNRSFFIERLRQYLQAFHPRQHRPSEQSQSPTQSQPQHLSQSPIQSPTQNPIQNSTQNSTPGQNQPLTRCAAFAVLFLDVDHFKVVNDSLGHTLGDELLVAIARRLERCIRDHDIFARLGGDEFAILLKDVHDVELAEAIADRIKAVLSFPFKVAEREVFTSVSVGIAHSDNDSYQTPEDVLRDADIAMYRSKAQGRASATVFDSTMHNPVLSRLQIETGLRQAVQDLLLNQDPQFALHYQPIVALTTGAIIGFEALLRWTNADIGRIAPLEFIPVAEETGLIVSIGRWVLQEACGQLGRWQRLPGCADLKLCVNVSSRQFLQPEFISDMQHILQSTQVDPACLKLEITESVLMETATAVTERLEQLREMGIHLSLDDFGTGYSSLSYLHRFPINTLKVDRSFIQRLATGQDQIVRAIVALAHGLKMDTVAEGIETAEQLSHLQSLGCEFGQGYLFSPPVPPEAAAQLLIQPPDWIP